MRTTSKCKCPHAAKGVICIFSDLDFVPHCVCLHNALSSGCTVVESQWQCIKVSSIADLHVKNWAALGDGVLVKLIWRSGNNGIAAVEKKKLTSNLTQSARESHNLTKKNICWRNYVHIHHFCIFISWGKKSECPTYAPWPSQVIWIWSALDCPMHKPKSQGPSTYCTPQRQVPDPWMSLSHQLVTSQTNSSKTFCGQWTFPALCKNRKGNWRILKGHFQTLSCLAVVGYTTDSADKADLHCWHTAQGHHNVLQSIIGSSRERLFAFQYMSRYC